MDRLLVGAILVLLTACSDPITMIPGGSLRGDVAPAPAQWTALDAIETIQVEFRPSDPYSINIWAVGLDNDLYIATGADGTRWTPMLEADANVRVRIDGTVYELTASRVTKPTEVHRVANAYSGKYELDLQDNWVMNGMIFRLDPRAN